AVVDGMRAEAEHIWSSLDVRVVWIDSVGAGSSAAADADMTVVLEETAAAPDAGATPAAVRLAAMRQPDVPCGPGFARVWVPNARRHAAGVRIHGTALEQLPNAFADIVLTRMLGRALAHEIGHYLLGTKDHSPFGLMRARFVPREMAYPPGEALYGLDSRLRRALQLRPCGSEVGSLGHHAHGERD